HNRHGSSLGSSSLLYSSNKSLYNESNFEENDAGLSKLPFVLNFNVNITCKEVRGLKSIPTNRIVYCTMEVEGGEKYRTEHAEAGKPVWESLAEFSTNQILPIINVKDFMENPGLLSLHDNKLGKLSLQIDPIFNKTNWWIDMIKCKYTSNEQFKFKLDVRMEKPQNLKMYGAMLEEKMYGKHGNDDIMHLFRFNNAWWKIFLKAVREGDVVTFATNEENERHSWVQALYRATGQSHKPTPITQINKLNSSQDKKIFQGWLSPIQSYVLEEYCSRYGVRGCLRHLYYLNDLLDRAEQEFMIDPQLLHYSYGFCTSHVSGNRPDNNVSTITMEKRDRFIEIKERLKQFLENQVTNFRFSFPFGRPEAALKATLSLLECVLSKDISIPISRDDIRNFIRKCLENAAYSNYTRVSDQAKVEAELCIELLQQDSEHYQEAFKQYNDLLIEHEEIFWSLFAVNMEHVIDQQPIENTLSNSRFHQQLRDTFAPLVIRYIDLIEHVLHNQFIKVLKKKIGNQKRNQLFFYLV
ncbi:unnamed protein product, partial [Rotaria sp. Silwood2]